MAHLKVFMLSIFVFAGFQWPVEGNLFLAARPAHAGVLMEDLNFEKNLLAQMEAVLGSEHRMFTEKRLETIKQSLAGIFAALPKKENGKLGNAAVSYALYRLFVQRHAWFIIGLEPFKALAEWESTSPISVIERRTPAYITGLFNTRLGKHGLGLHELAVLAATIEHLVHMESLVRLSVAYRALDFTTDDTLTTKDVDQVMDNYMAIYVMGTTIMNLSNVSTAWVRYLRENITNLYPNFPETQQFLREVSESVAPNRDYFYYTDMASLVEEVGDRYGRWQDYECRALKDMLVGMEDASTGGAGRVRLADFYKAKLYDGKWQFSESVEYLRSLGALDESISDNLRVIIPNYINGPSNCVASSSYYSVCCINECEEILSHLEMKIVAPEATPTQIASIVAQLPSATLSSNRTLSPWLLQRLNEVAEHHGGLVPIHGRLLAQWLHYAYPRECVYPHVVGTTWPQTSDQYLRETDHEYEESETGMKAIIETPVPFQKRVEDTDDFQEVLQLESAMWTMEEELVVVRSPMDVSAITITSFQLGFRSSMFILCVVSASLSLIQKINQQLARGPQGTEKHYV